MAFVALGFFSLIFHFGKSPPLSIKPEVHRVGEKQKAPPTVIPLGKHGWRGPSMISLGGITPAYEQLSRVARYSSQ